MADIDVLSAKLEVKDTFTSQLNKFIKVVDDSEKAYDKFMTKLEQSTSKMEQSIDKVSRKFDQFTQKINSVNKNISNTIENTTKKVEQVQTSSIENISKKYSKMGTDVQGVFKSINKNAEDLAKSGVKINLGGSNSNKEDKDSTKSMLGGIFSGDKTESLLSGVLSGSFSRVLGTLSIIGAGITGVKKVLDTIDGWMQQGFNAINTLSGNLLSYDGLKEGLQSAGQFETNRVAMNTLYGNNETVGQQYYKMGTLLAKNTPYSEQGVGELQKKLAGAKVNYTDKDLMTLLDIASIKPELGAEHVGFSIVDAMAGRSTSLKTNYMLDNKEINKYLQEAMKGKIIDKVTKQKVDGKQWKDAFNKTGTVNNKQEYLDLLISYVRNETKYSGLTEKYSKTMNGLMDRIKGNWETIEADLLGIDANNTGMAKSGTTVFNSVKNFIDYLDKWLSSSNAKVVFDSVGNGLGKAVDAVAKSLEYLLEHVNWDEVGKKIEAVGKGIADFINNLVKSGALDKLLEVLPKLAEMSLNNKVIDAETKANQAKQMAEGNPFGAGVTGIYGWWERQLNNMGWLNSKDVTNMATASTQNTESSFSDKMSTMAMQSNNILAGIEARFIPSLENRKFLTNANADTYLAQNPNLSDDQRTQIKDIISDEASKGHTIYNITVGEVKSDNAEDLIQQMQQLQSNQK